MNKILIAASILSADFTKLGEEISSASTAGTDWIHIDVMDGRFVPNISMGPKIVETCRGITRLPLDVHLMIENPERHAEAFVEAGADWLSIHIENNPNIHRTLQLIRSLGCKPGIVVNPGTPAVSIEAVIEFVDLILIMTVNPGFGGQKFIPEMSRKITQIQTLVEKYNPAALIEVDGGITAETLPAAFKAGAQVFVAGTSVFNFPSGIREGVAALRAAAN